MDASVHENAARLLREGDIEGYDIVRGACGAAAFVNNAYSSGPADPGKTLQRHVSLLADHLVPSIW